MTMAQRNGYHVAYLLYSLLKQKLELLGSARVDIKMRNELVLS